MQKKHSYLSDLGGGGLNYVMANVAIIGCVCLGGGGGGGGGGGQFWRNLCVQLQTSQLSRSHGETHDFKPGLMVMSSFLMVCSKFCAQ